MAIPRVRVWIELKNAIVFLLRLALVILTIPNTGLPCTHHFSWELWGSRGQLGVRMGSDRKVFVCAENLVCVCVCASVSVSVCMFNYISLEINIFIKHACYTPLTEAFFSIQRPQY